MIPVVAGNTLTYTVAVTNGGPTHASNVSLTDALPIGTTFVSATMPGWTCTTPAVGANGTVTCTLASFVPGDRDPDARGEGRSQRGVRDEP